MTVQANISIVFEAADPAEVDAIVGGLSGLPPGAVVGTLLHQQGIGGTVDEGGEIVPHPELEPPPPPDPEEEP